MRTGPMAPRIDTLKAAVRRLGYDSRRSELWVYMKEKHSTFAQWRADGATWPIIGKAVREAGLKDRDLKPPTDETVRQTFAKVEAFLRRAPRPNPRKKAPPVRALRPGEIAPGVMPIQPEVPPEQSVGGGAAPILTAEPEQPRRRFRKIATFRGEE